jgi:hypothetical protein
MRIRLETSVFNTQHRNCQFNFRHISKVIGSWFCFIMDVSSTTIINWWNKCLRSLERISFVSTSLGQPNHSLAESQTGSSGSMRFRHLIVRGKWRTRTVKKILIDSDVGVKKPSETDFSANALQITSAIPLKLYNDPPCDFLFVFYRQSWKWRRGKDKFFTGYFFIREIYSCLYLSKFGT